MRFALRSCELAIKSEGIRNAIIVLLCLQSRGKVRKREVTGKAKSTAREGTYEKRKRARALGRMKVLRSLWRQLRRRPAQQLDERQLRDAAVRASSWMAPWERAQMDAPRQPLQLWEKVYWRLFVVFGGVGLAYEMYVVENRVLMRATRQKHTFSAEEESISVSPQNSRPVSQHENFWLDDVEYYSNVVDGSSFMTARQNSFTNTDCGCDSRRYIVDAETRENMNTQPS